MDRYRIAVFLLVCTVHVISGQQLPPGVNPQVYQHQGGQQMTQQQAAQQMALQQQMQQQQLQQQQMAMQQQQQNLAMQQQQQLAMQQQQQMGQHPQHQVPVAQGRPPPPPAAHAGHPQQGQQVFNAQHMANERE